MEKKVLIRRAYTEIDDFDWPGLGDAGVIKKTNASAAKEGGETSSFGAAAVNLRVGAWDEFHFIGEITVEGVIVEDAVAAMANACESAPTEKRGNQSLKLGMTHGDFIRHDF